MSSRYDELDGKLWLDQVLVPWERVFLTEPTPEAVASWLFWHQLYCWLSKGEFALGLALAALLVSNVYLFIQIHDMRADAVKSRDAIEAVIDGDPWPIRIVDTAGVRATSAAEQALREAGCVSVERLDLCTSCRPDLFFSFRRDGKPRGGQGVIGHIA